MLLSVSVSVGYTQHPGFWHKHNSGHCLDIIYTYIYIYIYIYIYGIVVSAQWFNDANWPQ